MEKKLNIKKNYVFFGLLFVFVIFLVVMFVTSKSYALEGFGKLNLSCDKSIAYNGESIICNITGTVVSTSEISSLSSQVELSDNLEFVSFTTDSIWEGNGDNGNIQLYTDENKKDTFNIGTLTVKVKNEVSNTIESIKLKDNYFYDAGFLEQSIDEANVDIKTPQYSSSLYDLSNDYIISNTKDIASIIKGINIDGVKVFVENNNQLVTTGDITTGAKLKIMYGDNILDEFSIIYIDTSKYDLSNNYIIASVDNLVSIIDDFSVINGTLSVKNGSLVLSYNNTGIKSYEIINIYSNNYKIDLDNDYILINQEINNDILNNISKTNNTSLEINSGNLDIIYNENVVKTLKILSISSNKYDINFDKKYIYTVDDYTLDGIVSNISKNVNVNVIDNELKISYNNVSIMELNILSISSKIYMIDNVNNYIYTNADNDISTLRANFKLINLDISNKDNKLCLQYNDEDIKTFEWYYISSNEYKIDSNNIYIKDYVDYEDFTNNIMFNGLEIEIYNVDLVKVTSGEIEDDYSVNIYMNGKKLSTFKVKTEYLEINNLDYDEENKIIYNINLNSTYEELLKNIDTTGTIELYDKNGKKIENNSKVMSFSTVKIILSSITYEYKVVVFGDVTGSGDVNAGDVAKLYQYVREKVKFNNSEILAGDVTRDGNVLINDVSKLYSYLRGKLNTLE